jgi:hypothetical protein
MKSYSAVCDQAHGAAEREDVRDPLTNHSDKKVAKGGFSVSTHMFLESNCAEGNPMCGVRPLYAVSDGAVMTLFGFCSWSEESDRN